MGFMQVQNQDSLKVIAPASSSSTTENQQGTTSAGISSSCSCIKSPSSSTISSNGNFNRISDATSAAAKNAKTAALRQWVSVCANSINFIALLLIGSIAFVSSGASLAWISAYMDRMSSTTEFISEWSCWLVSAYPASAAVSVVVIFRWYQIGLRLWIVIATLCLTASWILTLLRQVDLYLVLTSRILAGFGTGTIFLTVPLYLSHFAKMKTNMKIERAMNTMWILGALIQYLSSSSAINTAISGAVSGVTAAIQAPIDYNEWIMAMSMAILAIIPTIGFLFFAPESPQTLVRREKYTKARQLLGKYLDGDNEEVVTKMQCFTVEEVKSMKLSHIFKQKNWIEKLVPVFGLIIFDALLGITVISFFLQTMLHATESEKYPAQLQVLVFCLGLMFGAVIRLPMLCRLLSKSSFILSGAIIFVAFGVLGTYYHMQSLKLSMANDYRWLPLVCLLAVAAYYAGGLQQNAKLYQQVMTSNRNRFAVRTLGASVSWFITAAIAYKFNHAIWYIGPGWIYYNMAIVTFFLMVFALLLVPQVVKSAEEIVSSSSSDESEGSQRFRGSTSDISTDVTMDCVLIV